MMRVTGTFTRFISTCKWLSGANSERTC